MEEARKNKKTIPIPPTATDAHRDVIKIVNTDEDGRHDATIHRKWNRYIRSQIRIKSKPKADPPLPWEIKKSASE